MTFVNTPLQNLRNILSEADFSAEKSNKRDSKLVLNKVGESQEYAISKMEVKKAIRGLKDTPRQYVTRIEVSKIFFNICKEKEVNVNFDTMETLKGLLTINTVLLSVS